MDNLKYIVAKNLIKLRKENKLTQGELASRINYSDKAISKWERGESLPDLSTLKLLADVYKIKIDTFFIEGDEPIKMENQKPPLSAKSKWFIGAISIITVWLLSTIIFVALRIFLPSLQGIWLCFIYAIPMSAIVAIIFASLWGPNWSIALCVTVLIWTLPLSIYLTFNIYDLWLFFLIGIPLQFLVILWYGFRDYLKFHNKNKKEKN